MRRRLARPGLIAQPEHRRADRERKGLSQEELGFEAELDRTYVSGIECGVRNPTVVTIRRIAAALEVAPSKLVKAAEGG
jgi:transcriptional regulator with XRE-family HTH domain